MEESIRHSQFSGLFYPKPEQELDDLLQFILTSESHQIATRLSQYNIIGAIVPHAGYIYSGYHAVHAYELIKRNKANVETVVIINPNHTGNGNGPLNVSCANKWETPLGLIEQDNQFIENLNIDCNELAHKQEHSGEVQLPFLQKFMPNQFKIVMITMNIQNHENAILLAEKIHKAATNLKRKILVLATSDFSHFEKVETGSKKDQYLISQILRMNAEECYKQVRTHSISACGYGPIMTLIKYAKLVARNPQMELLRRGHSGEIYKADKVVNYASFLCYEQQQDMQSSKKAGS